MTFKIKVIEMKKYMVIYNPSSGRETAGSKAFQACKYVMEKTDTEITFFATKKKNDAFITATKACDEGYDLIIACGGDGTVHEVVNGIMNSENITKLAILPSGTINDFAEQLCIPSIPEEFANLLLNPKFEPIDLGFLGDKYFMNVVCGGAFTNIPHKVNIDAKTIFGKYAYYFQAALEIPGQIEKSYNINYTIDGEEYNIDTVLFLISNTSSAGGFKYLSPKAKFNDGYLDIIIIEKAPATDLFQIFTGVFNGTHINHPKVHYHQAKNIDIECEQELIIDIDGELGGKTPINLTSVYRPLEILVP